MIDIIQAIVSYDDLVRQGQELAQALKDLQIALDKGREVTIAFNQAITERNIAQSSLLDANRALGESVARERELQARILELTKPPVVIPPPTSPQKVTRTALGRWAGFTIEHGKVAPSVTQSAIARKAMDWGKGMGMDLYRIFLNPSETGAMRKMTADNPENFIAYGRSIGLRWMADTMDTILGLLPSRDALKLYCDHLIAMGCEGFYVNDADRAAIPFETLKIMIGRLRDVAPDMPIFLSLMGSANLDLYKTVADYVEIQTFGTVLELATFLKRGAIPCLDLRKPLTAADLKLRAEVALRFPPACFFFYADLAQDYQDMPDDEDVIVKGFIEAWKKLA
jgi:hypothetical protein